MINCHKTSNKAFIVSCTFSGSRTHKHLRQWFWFRVSEDVRSVFWNSHSHPKPSPGQKGCLPGGWLKHAWQVSIGWTCHIEKVLAPWVAAGFSPETEAVSLLQPSLGSPIQSFVTQIRSIECERDYPRGVNIIQVRTPGARWEAGILGSWFLHLQLFHPPRNLRFSAM